jgi:hypothetical protein
MYKLLELVCVIVLFVILNNLPGGECLQCYNCRGITNYDPNSCFEPSSKTTMQECQKNEVCEKRVTMVDRLQDVIDRGCSSNCAGRLFWWTDEYQVYCCSNDRCNDAIQPRAKLFDVIFATAVAFLCALTVFLNR